MFSVTKSMYFVYLKEKQTPEIFFDRSWAMRYYLLGRTEMGTAWPQLWEGPTFKERRFVRSG